ncbi:hypothetical protein EDB84DRAFT_1462824 [Lactarius hengduanensis]|nr:hypothetical protein EDB84DRAFT_1462824 [Lactarius hengduanensis]
MDLGAFHPRNLFSWRSSLSDTRRLDEQSPTADAQAVTVKVPRGKEQATISKAKATGSQTQISSNSQAGPLATKRFTGTLRASQKDASKWDKVPGQSTRRLGEYGNTIQQDAQYNRHPPVAPTLTDLAGKVKGMYRLLDLIGESGSNGYVDKVIISQDSLQHFINAVSPGAYTSITKVDFKALDRFMIRPLGVYGSKDGIVHLLRSIGVVDEDIATSLLSPSDVGNSRATLSSGLYIVKANATDLVDERHYVIYWPEDSTWNDSANSSVRRNRVTFMRYLTKICDQVVALLTPEQSASIVWNEEQSNAESADIDVGDDSDRLFTFEVAETNEQEESAVARPGFQLNSPYISPGETPPDCPVDPATLAPRLLPGETRHAFWTATYVPHQTHAEILDEHTFTQVALKQLLMNSALVLSENLDGNAVQILVGVAIAEHFPEQCDKWRARNQGARTKFMQELTERKETVRKEVIRGEDSLRRVLHEAVVEDVIGLFPSLERDRLSQASRPRAREVPNADQGAENSLRLSDLESLYPDFRSVYQKHVQNARFGIALRRDSYFENRKLRLVAVRHLLDKHQNLPSQTRSELIQALLKGDFYRAQHLLSKTDGKKRADSGGWSVGSIFSGGSGDLLGRDMRMLAGSITDSQFLLDVKGITETETRPATQEIETLAHAQLASTIDAAVKAMTRNVLAMQQEYCTRSIQHEMESEERKSLNNALIEFIRDVNAQSSERQDSVVYIDGVIATQSVGWRDPVGYYDDVEVEWGTRPRSHYGQEYVVTGRQEVLQEPRLEYWVYPMDLTSDDKHNMQLDPKYIPQPTVNNRLSSAFHLPIGVNVAFCQVLENEKLLLILVDQVRVAIYLERLPGMDMAIERHRPVKVLNREKLEQDILFAFDETKRTLAVCAPTKLHFHMFVFDETFKTLQGQGSGINLAPWYSQASETSITHIAFVCGTEEVVFVDSAAQARIFSFVSMQFRPASLQLPSPPSAIFSSPDGACLITLHTQSEQPSLTAYHWETFGSTTGIALDVPKFPLQDAVLTSLVVRGRVFLLALDVDSSSVKSIAIDITKKLTEFMFKENGSRNASNNKARHTLHNSLLDCHAEVWSRYPVLAAVRRRTVTSLSERKQKCLTFITEDDSRPFNAYFSDLIQTFERTTRKPTGDELRRIKVSAEQFGVFKEKVVLDPDWDVSRYRVGEWLVDVFCLIPIHIAVCRENRFVPLANGVLSSDLERTLLGAEVNKIVDKLSFGWYESIFQSYMATKPVKVVSSMGQQSVGKSFALNHLLDTSFAGSAMRTTEGVWMSVTPTDDALVVALDFEGVDSVERSLQEDTLLVLFNTAISNLVLFRNNFAFSRDISGLFQSFQSSASVLDPAANPSLFQSTLVIIIKDVVESDKVEITREFSLKFQKIVQQEQRANFISRLHRGRLNIIPWPVIESREFYNLFSTLKRRLDLQSVSHSTAGEFLHTIKTLMAKLKANDWGALSQTMTEHRAKTLSTLLPIALATGFSEIEPDFESLKNLDTDLEIEGNDTDSRFAISGREQISPMDIERHLSVLLESWNQSMPRQFTPDSEWIEQFVSHLHGVIDLRVNYVRLWLDSNLERFQDGHATIEDLLRRFDNMVIEMRANVQLCGVQCASCHLLCVRGRLHEGDHSCKTTHRCVHDCKFCKGSPKPCGSRAGHPGEHVCVVNAHLCGEPCALSGKRGCLDDCTKVAGHVGDEHRCSALVHMCGEPCALQEMKILGGKTYSCAESCCIPSDQEHTVHSCGMRLCPAACELCKRLCIQPHLHGTMPGESHLCGEAHSCSALCSASGICQIDTSPMSVEATFTGRHETFQYTKYTQVAKRLQCVKTIQPGRMSHSGPHIHGKEKQIFHFCETRCQSCGYFCTLPLGHTQQEHETSHGSMTQTRWAIDGPDDTGLELGGRKFSSNDEGAPMMCSLVCSSMGRHVHIDYCRAGENAPCDGAEVQHINARMVPNPDKPKDAITHSLYWRRKGFKDPYTRDEQTNFAKCDAMCSGPEHSATSGQPSYCTLPLFHPQKRLEDPVNGSGYISNDGHLFDCRSPAVMQQAFHVIFVIDKSGSMDSSDRQPLAEGPAAERIQERSNNRLGAVYSALYSFWSARHAAVAAGQRAGTQRGLDSVYSALYSFWSARNVGATGVQEPTVTRRDAYSVILFNDSTTNAVINDFTSSPDQLLDVMLSHRAYGGTNFATALRAAQATMVQNWSTERTPIMIFLSDGQSAVSDEVVQDLCRSTLRLGKQLSFHAVSFGPDSSAPMLRKMAQIALETQESAPQNAGFPAAASVPPSSFATALDTVRTYSYRWTNNFNII